MTDEQTTDPRKRVIEAATDAVRTYPRHVRRRADLVEAVRVAMVTEFERMVILGRVMDEDPTPNEEALIDALMQLPAQRIGAVAQEAIGRRTLDLDLAVMELGIDPDDLTP
jgi:7,8-dihydro-6-hydroxymethylpterin-pyrophosphokinase